MVSTPMVRVALKLKHKENPAGRLCLVDMDAAGFGFVLTSCVQDGGNWTWMKERPLHAGAPKLKDSCGIS